MPIDLTQLEKTLKEIAEKAVQVSETAATIPEPKPIFDVDTPTGEVDISQLDSVQDLRNQVRGLETRFASEKEAQEELIASLEPTPRALELQKDILAERQAGRAGEVGIKAEPIPQPLIGLQAEKLREQVELREMPLIEELKLEVQKQQTTFEKAKAKLGFETAGIERVLDLESEFRQMDRAQRQDARGLLEGIIGSLEGMAFKDLSPEQQTMLETMVKNAGVSIEVIKAGMANAKRLAAEKKVKEYAPTQYTKEWQEAGGLAGTNMTQAEWIAMRTKIELPKQWSDEELRTTIRAMMAEDVSYDQAISEIELDPTVLNKERAKFVTAELYGQIESGTTFEEFIGKAPPTPAKVVTELSSEQKEAVRAGKLIIDPKTGRIATPESLIKKEPETPEGFLLGVPDYTTPLYFK